MTRRYRLQASKGKRWTTTQAEAHQIEFHRQIYAEQGYDTLIVSPHSHLEKITVEKLTAPEKMIKLDITCDTCGKPMTLDHRCQTVTGYDFKERRVKISDLPQLPDAVESIEAAVMRIDVVDHPHPDGYHHRKPVVSTPVGQLTETLDPEQVAAADRESCEQFAAFSYWSRWALIVGWGAFCFASGIIVSHIIHR